MRARAVWTGALAIGLVAALVRAEQPPVPAQTGVSEAIRAEVEIERTLLKEDQARHRRLAAERDRAAEELSRAYQDLDAAVLGEDASEERLGDLSVRLERAEKERAELLVTERVVIEMIRNRLRRLALFEARLAEVQARAVEEAGPLAGRWEVVLMPAGQRGSFQMTQNGTLLTGSYALDGGFTGNLRGTLVERKVFLERIDSRLGRCAEFEGYLSTDGGKIRGTWLAYDLNAPGGANGQWSAERKPPAP